MRADEWYRAQRGFYARRRHRHLEASQGGHYAENLISRVWAALGAPDAADGVEVGCGAGRFTFPLLTRCRSLQAVDLSAEQLARLRLELARRAVDPVRCRLHQANAEELGSELSEQRYDFVVGVFFLHHLHDLAGTLAKLRRLLRPGGRLAFLEPNRWNPLYALQLTFSRDMTWRDEWRLYRISERSLRLAFREAGFGDCAFSRFGLLPPAIVNRFPKALRLERAIERVPLARPFLPYLVASARREVAD
jgi:SAM-dependent methyltransferase